MTVLLLGRHLELGHYRVEFLKSHGINVIFPEDENSAFDAVRRGGYDIVIISYSLPDRAAKELTELLEQVYPHCPLICISEQRWRDRDLKPHATVLSSDPPQVLLDAINRLSLQRKSIRRVK